MNCKVEVFQYIKEKYNMQDLKEDSALFTSGAIDSFGIIELISELENKYKIHLNDEDLSKGNFETVEAIANLIDRKRND